MSGGLNKLFLANPSRFMTSHLYNSQPHIGLSVGAAGVKRINLATSGALSGKAVTEVQPAGNNRSNFSHAFNAYYLPWKQGAATTLQLGTGAGYFFTPALTGCRLIIGAGTQPLITHVDGGSYTNMQMDAMCNTRSNGNYGVQRYWDNGAFYACVVVGVRSFGGWSFYEQSYNPNSNFPFTVTQV